MTFLVTASGHELDLYHAPAPGHITAWSIAWSLAQINRFNGQALRPYSVAEHSLLVAEIAERELGLDIHGQLAALLHDAHEAWCGDVPSPSKPYLGPAWARWENHWLRHTRSAFAIVTPSAVYAQQIKQADLMALATERRDLMPSTPTPWTALHDVTPISWTRLNSPERTAMTWEDWRDRWLDRYHELDFARNERVLSLDTHPQPPRKEA